MAIDRRFYKGADNYIRLRLKGSAILNDGTVAERVPLKVASALRVSINLRATQGPPDATLPDDIFFDTAAPPDEDTFIRDDEGLLAVRFGDLAEPVLGVSYQPRIKLYDADNPDGLVVMSYGDDATNETMNLLCS